MASGGKTLEQIDEQIAAVRGYLAELLAERRTVAFKWGANSPVLAELAKAYADPEQPLATICIRFKTSIGRVMCLARQHGWQRRVPPLPVPLKKMPDRTRRLYLKVHRVAGREAALAAVDQ